MLGDSVEAAPEYPGTPPPERTRKVPSAGIEINTLEWGDPEAQPVVLAHGMWDHARSFAVLGPLLADRYRVVALDARGHGDSGWADAYGWGADIHDLINVVASVGRPVHLVGHSKGGGQASDAARLVPELVAKLVNIDGFGPPSDPEDDVPLPERMADSLDARHRRVARASWRPYRSLEDLVERRLAQNPRLERAWLRFFAWHAARLEPDGWHWKHDPIMGRFIGPFSPDWIGPSWAVLRMPMLAVVGSEPDTWGPLPEPLLSQRLAAVPRLERVTVEGAGHFVHMEKPVETAKLLLDWLAS
jgi:pimeloyl-ACP methyl ester carboxylesterase